MNIKPEEQGKANKRAQGDNVPRRNYYDDFSEWYYKASGAYKKNQESAKEQRLEEAVAELKDAQSRELPEVYGEWSTVPLKELVRAQAETWREADTLEDISSEATGESPSQNSEIPAEAIDSLKAETSKTEEQESTDSPAVASLDSSEATNVVEPQDDFVAEASTPENASLDQEASNPVAKLEASPEEPLTDSDAALEAADSTSTQSDADSEQPASTASYDELEAEWAMLEAGMPYKQYKTEAKPDVVDYYDRPFNGASPEAQEGEDKEEEIVDIDVITPVTEAAKLPLWARVLRVATTLILICAIGFLGYQLVLNYKNPQIEQGVKRIKNSDSDTGKLTDNKDERSGEDQASNQKDKKTPSALSQEKKKSKNAKVQVPRDEAQQQAKSEQDPEESEAKVKVEEALAAQAERVAAAAAQAKAVAEKAQGQTTEASTLAKAEAQAKAGAAEQEASKVQAQEEAEAQANEVPKATPEQENQAAEAVNTVEEKEDQAEEASNKEPVDQSSDAAPTPAETPDEKADALADPEAEQETTVSTEFVPDAKLLKNLKVEKLSYRQTKTYNYYAVVRITNRNKVPVAVRGVAQFSLYKQRTQADDDYLKVLAPGESGVLRFYHIGYFDNYELTLEASRTPQNSLQDKLQVEVEQAKDKSIHVEAKNLGDKALEFVQVEVLFFFEDELHNYDRAVLTEKMALEPGESLTAVLKTVDTYYDQYEVYWTCYEPSAEELAALRLEN